MKKFDEILKKSPIFYDFNDFTLKKFPLGTKMSR
jgi:hypothetical protein